jgi:hypothetical protein
MDFETVEVAFLAGLKSPPRLTMIEMATANPIIVTCGKGKAIDDINRAGVQLFPGLTQQVEQGQEQICDPMPSTIEATFPQHMGNIAIFLQVMPRLLKVPAEVQYSHDRRSHYFGVADLALWVFVMAQGFQHVVTKAKDCDNLGVHAILRFSVGSSTINFTRFRMDLSVRSPLGGNLGYLL